MMRFEDSLFLLGIAALAAGCPGDDSAGGSSGGTTSTGAPDPTGTPDDLCEGYGRRSAECGGEPQGYDQYVEFYTMTCEAELAMFEGECIAFAEEFYACFGAAECAELASGACKAEAVAYHRCLPTGTTG